MNKANYTLDDGTRFCVLFENRQSRGKFKNQTGLEFKKNEI